MLRTPTDVDDLAQHLLGCVCAALDDTASRVEGQPGCPCVTCVHPGQPAWDSCCDCTPAGRAGGQLNVWVERVYPTGDGPWPEQQTTTAGPRCLPAGTGVAADLVVTLLRCAPAVDDQGNPPGCEALQRAARITHVDLVTVLGAATCCLPTAGRARGSRRVLVRDARLVGPEGGCVGVEVRLTVDLGAPCLCVHGEPSL